MKHVTTCIRKYLPKIEYYTGSYKAKILNAMNNILLILNSIHSTNLDDHPKLLIIFNDLSRNEESKAQEKIESYKRQLKDFVKAFYL